jgi:cation diffusion facilitator CzcD-associated flavoprotein CzcO
MDTLALESLPVAVIGGGPVGLAAAAHLIARGLPVKVYEAGSGVGSNIRDWGHVRIFTPRRYCVDAAATALLAGRAWRMPDADAFSYRRRPGERVSGAACHHSRANGRH